MPLSKNKTRVQWPDDSDAFKLMAGNDALKFVIALFKTNYETYIKLIFKYKRSFFWMMHSVSTYFNFRCFILNYYSVCDTYLYAREHFAPQCPFLRKWISQQLACRNCIFCINLKTPNMLSKPLINLLKCFRLTAGTTNVWQIKQTEVKWTLYQLGRKVVGCESVTASRNKE